MRHLSRLVVLACLALLCALGMIAPAGAEDGATPVPAEGASPVAMPGGDEEPCGLPLNDAGTPAAVEIVPPGPAATPEIVSAIRDIDVGVYTVVVGDGAGGTLEESLSVRVTTQTIEPGTSTPDRCYRGVIVVYVASGELSVNVTEGTAVVLRAGGDEEEVAPGSGARVLVTGDAVRLRDARYTLGDVNPDAGDAQLVVFSIGTDQLGCDGVPCWLHP